MEQVTISNTEIPPDIAKAVLAVQTKLGTIGKDDVNPFQGFSYVSIDKYYQHVATVATSCGISWFCKEVGSEIVHFQTAPNPKMAIKFDYVFTIFHVSGACVPAYDRVSIYHPVQGAQTSGSAASYAEKLFMRKAFKVVTGEGDADATPSDDLAFDMNDFDTPSDLDIDPLKAPDPEPTPVDDLPDLPTDDAPSEPEPPFDDDLPTVDEPPSDEEVKQTAMDAQAPLEEESNVIDITELVKKVVENPIPPVKIKRPGDDSVSWDDIFRAFEVFIPTCEDMDMTKQFWNENTKTIELMKAGSPENHAALIKMFKEHQAGLAAK